MEKSNRISLTTKIKLKGLELGFAKVGITTADDFEEYIDEITYDPDYGQWLDQDLSFHVAKGARPREVFPPAKSIVYAAYGYGDIVYPKNLSKYVGYSYLSRCYSPLKTSSCGLRVEALKNYLIEQGCNVYSEEMLQLQWVIQVIPHIFLY